MKIDYNEIVCCSSISEPNTWYLFRPNGIEVVLKLVGNTFKSNKELTDLEVEYLNKNLK